jgi:tetratricopeptide (TPR) repeat protein
MPAPNINTIIERGRLLLLQSRYKLAEQELQRALTIDAENPTAHSLLAACYSGQHKPQKALQLAPHNAYGYFVLGWALVDQHQLPRAKQAAEDAIRLNPHKADYFFLLGEIALRQMRWKDALHAAEEGLKLTPEHIDCLNVRARALTKQNRPQEAQIAINEALRLNPENARTRTNQGWLLLETNRGKEAMGHFREALRLNPQLQWAHEGVIEALHSRYFIYRLLICYFFWFSRFGYTGVGLLMVGLYLGCCLSMFFLPVFPYAFELLVGAFFTICFLPIISAALFNVLLRFDSDGRLVLSDEQITASYGTIVCIFIASAGLITWLLTNSRMALDIAIWWFVMIAPIRIVFLTPNTRAKKLLGFCTVLVVIAGATIIVMSFNPRPLINTIGAILLVISLPAGIISLGLLPPYPNQHKVDE